MKILVLNGPNINMLGIREPEIYGSNTYEDLCNCIYKWADEYNLEVDIYQSNHEGDLIDKIQQAYNKYDGIIINAGGYTHTSVAIADALAAVGIVAVEVHISDLSKRETYRHISFLKKHCIATISGQGILGYKKALEIFISK